MDSLKDLYAKEMDFTDLDFSAWKTDEDHTPRRYDFWFRRSNWGPRPISVVVEFNPHQSQSFSVNPEEFVKLYDAMGEFITEHSLRDHV